MNKQGEHGIEWTDATWNVIGGCLHECKWQMPDGSIAQCYAKTIAERFAVPSYPQGFEEHYWHPERLHEPLHEKKPLKIFLDSMSDLMGHWVPDDQIEQVLDACREAPWHSFQLLTKNAPRLTRFQFPANVWVGASVPPTFWMGKRLSQEQQERMLRKTLKTLGEVNATIRWMSIEPLSWDVSQIFLDLPLNQRPLDWIIIGAASNGKRIYQPDEQWITNLLEYCDYQQIPVFFKGNLKWSPWREAFPVQQSVKQLRMF